MQQLHTPTLAVVLALSPTTLAAQEPILTEFMARNMNTLSDSDGDYSDWFEVYNPKSSSLQLGGYYVTDDPNDLRKWKFPATTIAAGRYLVVFASKKNRAVANQQLHTNFSLEGKGEYFALVKPDGATKVSEFSPKFPEQRSGYSYGRIGAQLLYFPTPTPGSANRNGVVGFVCKSTIQAKRGIQNKALSVPIACSTVGAAVHYTLDGSPPTQASARYTGPIPISKTTVLRARGFLTGLAPSPIDSHTFVFIEDTIRQPARPAGFPSSWGGGAPSADYEMDPQVVNDALYQQSVRAGLRSIPTLSLALPISSLFGSSGIYDNPTRSGSAWERETSAEYFDPATGREFQIQAGLRIQGGASRSPRKCPKHSLSLRFRDAYEGDLQFRLFSKSRVSRFDTLQMRGVYNNAWTHSNSSQRRNAMLIRDQFCRDTLIAMGQQDGGHGSYVCLYLNGVFWGIYNLHERAEAAHYAAWNGGDRDDYDARNGSGTVNGSSAAWNAMRFAVTSRNWSQVKQQLDVANYIDWLILNEYGGNQDWKSGGNWRAAGGGPGKAPWRFYSWDAERTLENPSQVGTRPSIDPPNLVGYLVSIPDFVTLFGDRVHRHFYNDGALTAKQAAERFTRRTTELNTAVVAESARWGDYRASSPYTRNGHWIPERNRLVNSYFPVRSSRILARYKSRGLYPTVAAPTFSQHGGKVKNLYSLQILGPGQIYYTVDGTDPRAQGGGISNTATRYSSPVILRLSTVVKARSLSSGKWSAVNEARFLIESISINEILAKNTKGIRDNFGEREDWIELHNKNAVPVKIGGMYLTDSANDPTRWRIPGTRTLAPGKTFLIWADDDEKQSTVSDNHANFKLTGEGEEVLLFDIDGVTLLDRLSFGPQAPDISTGRLHDGQARLVTFPDPTPRANNDLAVCGSRRYSSLDPSTQTQDLQLLGTPGLGKSITLRSSGRVSTGHCAFVLGVAVDETPLIGVSSSKLLISTPFLVLSIQPTGLGGVTDLAMTVPVQTSLIGQVVYLQSWGIGVGPWAGSSGVEIKICK